LRMKWRKSDKRPKWLDTRSRPKSGKLYRIRNKNLRAKHNFGSNSLRKSLFKEPEPLIDIFQNGENVMVVAELKGFRKENIKVHVEQRRLVISANAHGRSYHKILSLPKAVVPESMRMTYKNGVVEIILKKAMEAKAIKELAG